MRQDSVKLKTVTVLIKLADPDGSAAQALRHGADVNRFSNKVYEVKRVEGNVFLNEGIEHIWKAVTGVSGITPFNATHACIGVGDGTTPEDPTQTGLLGTNKYYKGMDAGYPQVSATSVTFRSTFGPDEANFAWNEWTVANGPGDGYVNLNRKVQNMGIKTPGSTWILTVQLSIS